MDKRYVFYGQSKRYKNALFFSFRELQLITVLLLILQFLYEPKQCLSL